MTIKDFTKYFATFQSDPLKKSIGLRGVDPKSWKQFGPILSSSTGYIEFTQQPATASAITPGGNTFITDIGFDFEFNGTTYNKLIASPHGWVSLLDPNHIPTASLDTIYNDRLLVSGSSSYVNSTIKSAFNRNDVLLAPWFDRQLMVHNNLDSFVTYYSGTSPSLVSQKENFLYGKIDSKDQPFNEFDYGMKYTTLEDSIEGKSLLVRWSSLGYEYRGRKLSFETALFQNGKIEFSFAPIGDYSTQYTLISLSSDPTNVWKLDESSGSTTNDAQGNKNLTYKTPSSMRPAVGKINTAAFFSGSASTVIYADQPSFANYVVTDSFSFSAWFKSAAGDSSTKCILSRMYYDYSKGYTFELAGGYLRLTMAQTYNTNALRVTSTTDPYNDGAWHHVVVTYNGTASSSGVKIYVDGQEISTTSSLTSLTTSSDIQAGSGGADFMIGAIGKYNNNDNRFSGSIDDVARWNSVLSSTDVDLLYTQGLTSISAADIDPIGDSTTSYATCGIFASGSSNWNYRDFAPLLGATLENRLTSSFGGALYTGSYTDIDAESTVTASYTVNLGLNNWPKHGGRITFSPPQERIKLIRSDINKYESNSLVKPGGFDARKTVSYVEQQNVDASTVLPQSYLVNSTYPGIHTKQSLYKDGGITVSNRKVLSSVSDYYLQDDLERLEKIAPFAEQSLFDQDKQDPFYLTGSISSFGSRNRSFARQLSSKKQVKLTFPVTKKTRMFTSASSLYYFNFAANQWNIPTQSLGDHVTSSFNKLATRATWDPGAPLSGSFYLEDKIGFDSQGNCIASGTLDVFQTGTPGYGQTIADIGTFFDANNHMNLIAAQYGKSIHRNSSYDAKNDELFSLPIDEPFLLEKAVLELPFCMGNGWFNDKTTFLITSASSYTVGGTDRPSFTWYDEGGPVVTVSLFCQRQYGQNKVRDLVFKTSFTHTDDVSKEIKFSDVYSGTLGVIHVASLVGNENNRNILSGNYVQYTTVNSKKIFTGSVILKSDVAVTNCAHIGLIKKFNMKDYENSGSMLSEFNSFLNSQEMSITSGSSQVSYILGVDALGRSMSGFGVESCGESITSAGILTGSSSVFNPFYFSSSISRQMITSSLETNFANLGSGSYLYCMTKLPLGKPEQSPYIIYPDDKLILAVSKSRPAYKTAAITGSLFEYKVENVSSSSYINNISEIEGHEVYFNTGTIHITLYGSNVQLGEEVQQ